MINQKYKLLEQIGEGGSGEVFRAYDSVVDKILAIKFINPDRAVNEENIRKEFTILSQINHPNLIRVFEFGKVLSSDETRFINRYYYSMEYLPGCDALAYFQQIPQGKTKAALLEKAFIQILLTLDLMHREGIIHYDIKPQNIFIVHNEKNSEREPSFISCKLIDFGFSTARTEVTEDVQLRGTPDYVAPELLQGKPFDERIDLYSLGATFYHLWEGTCPFQGNTPVDLFKNIITKNLPKPNQYNEASSLLPEIIERLCKKNSDDRYRSAREVLTTFASSKHESEIKEGLITVLKNTVIGREAERIGIQIELSQQEVKKLYVREFGTGVISEEFIERNYELYGGNPHIVIEEIRSLISAIPLALFQKSEILRVMESELCHLFSQNLANIFSTQTKRFQKDEITVLETMSCFDNPPCIELLQSLLPFDQTRLNNILVSLEREGVLLSIENGQRYKIRLRGFQNYLYSLLDQQNKKNLHFAIATQWEKMRKANNWPDYSELARHHELSGEREKAKECFIIAANLAGMEGNFAAAINLYNKVLTSNTVCRQNEISLLQKLAQNDMSAGRDADSIKIYEEILTYLPTEDMQHVHIHKNLGKSFTRIGDNSMALHHFEKAAQFSIDDFDRFDIQQEIISLKVAEGFFEDAIRLGNIQKNLALGFSNPHRVALVETDLGIAQFYQGNFQESLERFRCALHIYQDCHDTGKIISSFNNVGNVMSAMGDNQGALESWGDALLLATDQTMQHDRALILNNIGIAHFKLRDYENARVHYRQAQEIFSLLQSKKGIAFSLTNLGEVEYAEGNYELSCTHWNTALAIYTEMQEAIGICQTLLEIAQANFSIGLMPTTQIFLERANEIIQRQKLSTLIPFYHYLKGHWHRDREEYQAALEEFEISTKEFSSIEGAFTCGTESAEERIIQLSLRKAETFLRLDRIDEATLLVKEIADNKIQSLPRFLQAEIYYLLGCLARHKRKQNGFDQPIMYFRHGVAALENEHVIEITWKLYGELGKEYEHRGNLEKAQEHFGIAQSIIDYFSSKITSTEGRAIFLASRTPHHIHQQAIGTVALSNEGDIAL